MGQIFWDHVVQEQKVFVGIKVTRVFLGCRLALVVVVVLRIWWCFGGITGRRAGAELLPCQLTVVILVELLQPFFCLGVLHVWDIDNAVLVRVEGLHVACWG